MSRQRRTALRFGGALMAAALGLALFAGTAVGNTPSATMDCTNGLKVDLLGYPHSGDSRFVNTVSITVDGVPIVSSLIFWGDYHWQLNPIPPTTSPHTAKVVITTFDPDSPPIVTFDLKVGACTESTPTPTPTPTTPVIPCTPANNCFFNTPPPPPSTPTPTPTPVLTPTPSASSSPSGGVLGATGTPGVTPPSTSTIGSVSGSTGSGLPIAIAALVGLGLSVLLLTPRQAVSRTTRRRR